MERNNNSNGSGQSWSSTEMEVDERVSYGSPQKKKKENNPSREISPIKDNGEPKSALDLLAEKRAAIY